MMLCPGPSRSRGRPPGWHSAGNHLFACPGCKRSTVNIFGTYFPNKAAAIKDWTSAACNVTRVTLTHGVGTSISPSVGILTLTGTVEGTCGAQDISEQEIHATTVYVKIDDAWKWAFGFNSPS